LLAEHKTEGFPALHLTHDLSEIFLFAFSSFLTLGVVLAAHFLVFSWNGNYPSPRDLNPKGFCCLRLDLQVEVFPLGPLPQIMAKMVTGLASTVATQYGAQKRSMGLLLLDGSLHLLTPFCHNDVILLCVFFSLPCTPAKLLLPRPLGVRSRFPSCPVVRTPVDSTVLILYSTLPLNWKANFGCA